MALSDEWVIQTLRKGVDMLEAEVDAGEWKEAGKTAAAVAFIAARLGEDVAGRQTSTFQRWLDTLQERLEAHSNAAEGGN